MKIIADTNIPYVTQAFSAIGEIITIPGREINANHVRDADILLVRSVTRVNEALLSGSAVKFVGTATIGVDHIDLDYIKRNNIGFSSAPGCNAISAAEYVIGALLELARLNQWDIFSKTVAIVGVGNVGSNVLKRLQAIGINCLLYDPPRRDELADRDYVDWETIFQADIVTAHVPLTLSGQYPTRHMFDASFFEKLNTGATFINTSRGDVVLESQMKTLLARRRDLHLVLDVWGHEPQIDVELLQRTDLGTPHIAGYSLDGKVRGTFMIHRALCAYLGIEETWSGSITGSMPDNNEIHLNPELNIQDQLYDAVTRAYAIHHDDERLRQIIDIPEAERGGYFDRLRKDYPVRREFSNYSITLSGQHTRLQKMLEGMDFKVKILD